MILLFLIMIHEPHEKEVLDSAYSSCTYVSIYCLRNLAYKKNIFTYVSNEP